ncbi:tachykinin-like peptides receptor 99D isoform X2 [Bemisia tabaci]|uniref:tachykinin-like peptides receptor 99D isoform X2 n=1 Tax=Bemisia tabaci TaxID=7038 RepID=UPI0008F9A1EC|nr:PREDICTED: tachykinin-like peptides receptor 99D isoform X2 [Bemisia tabaci]
MQVNASMEPGGLDESVPSVDLQNESAWTESLGVSNETGTGYNQFILPFWKQCLWTMLFAPMILIACCGNLIVIWIVLSHKRMRTVTNYFLVNLSVADAMVSALNVTVNFVYMLSSDWPFGLVYCKIAQFISVLTICASVFTLMAISIERYMAIIYPLRPRMGRHMTLCIASSTWIIGLVLSLPQLLFYTTFTITFSDSTTRSICYAEWPDGATTKSEMEYVYNITFMTLTYFVPVCAMLCTYTRVGFKLWGSQSIGESISRQLDNIKSKRRAVKMMIVVVVIFAVCWLPFQIYFIVTSLVPEITESPFIQDVYLAIYWLAMSNSMYNPIIYYWMNARFRDGFKEFFSWCPFIHPSPEGLTRREVITSRYSCSGSPEAPYRIVRNEAVKFKTRISSNQEKSYL